MKIYVALLRGINVGGHHKIPMVELKQEFERIGFIQISTYINSGNVIFMSSLEDPKHIKSTIEERLEESFGFVIQIILRDRDQMMRLAHSLPHDWENNDTYKTDVLFLADEFCRAETIDQIKHHPDIDHLMYSEGSIVWHIDRAFYSKSGMGKFIGTPIYKSMSARNINTVRKLSQLLEFYGTGL